MANIKLEFFGTRLQQMLNDIDSDTFKPEIDGRPVPKSTETQPLYNEPHPDATTTQAVEDRLSLRPPETDIDLLTPKDMIPVAEAIAQTHMRVADIADLARELALYGEQFAIQVRRAYGLSDAHYLIVSRTPVFVNSFKKAQADLLDNDFLPMQLMARKLLLKHVTTLDKIAASGVAEHKDRLKAIDLMSGLAGEAPQKSKAAGPSIAATINFGAGFGSNLATVIEVKQ